MIKYRAGYKYQLAETYTVETGILPPAAIDTEFLSMDGIGVLTIRKGYAWDGPSGPAMDTPTAMRGSLAHDALYQLMRLGFLPPTCRKRADELYREICDDAGMWKPRQCWHFLALRLFASGAASPDHAKPILTAP